MTHERSAVESALRSALRFTALAALSAMTACTAWAQDVRTLRDQSWSTEEGLPQSSVHHLLQSRDGYIWLATEGGLARFDGVAFQTFSHATEAAFLSDDICCLAEDTGGAIWAGTADGLLRLQGGKARRYGTAEGLPSASITALVALTNGTLLVLTPSGLALGSQDGFRPALAEVPHVTAIAAARHGGAWLSTDKLVFRYENGVAHPANLRLPQAMQPLTGLAEAAGDALWLSSANEIALVSPLGFREWKTGQELQGSRIESLSVDRDGTAWVGLDTRLVQLNESAAEGARVPPLESVTVLDTMQDAEGNHWIGTDAAGVHVLRALKFRSVPALSSQVPTSVVEASDGAMWVGTRQGGLRRVRGDSVDQPVSVATLTSPVILSLAPGLNGSLWAGTPDGLNFITASSSVRRITSADGLPDDFIRSLQADPDGSVWAGTRRGLAHVSGTHVDTLTAADGLGGNLVGAMLRTTARPMLDSAPAALWIGTSGGLSCLHPDGSLRTYTRRDGLPGIIVTALAQDRDGVLWVATQDGGLSQFAGGRFQPVAGLPSAGEISAIATDSRGFLWLRAAREVERVASHDLQRCIADSAACSYAIARYGVADGLPSEEAAPGASPAMVRTEAGEVWITTRRGLGIADAEHLSLNTTPPPVVMQRFLIDEVPVPFGADALRIPYGHGRFTMEYAGLSYRVPTKVRYRFMLEGFDRGWTDAGARRSATYTNLPSRLYRFRVQASNEDGVWSPVGAELSFRITSPFYRRWWFYVALVLLAAGLFAVGYQLRLRRLRSQFEAVLQERNRIAREIHDTLAQDFVGVSIQLDIVSQLLGMAKIEAAAAQVASTRKLVIDGLAEARRSIWELRANTAHDSLPTRLSQLLERYRSEGMALRLRVGGVFRPLAPEFESEILRIAQEALANVKRHAEATEVTVQLRYSSDMLVLEVQDNGRGFVLEQAAAAEGHYGLQGMRERAAALNSELDISSVQGEGTRVRLSAPIPPPDGQAHAEAH